MKIITLTHQKGGVGKTTTAFMLAFRFAEKGLKTLAVDLDSQGNLTTSFGKFSKFSIKDVVRRNKKLEEILININDNLSVLPSNDNLVGLDYEIIKNPMIIGKLLKSIKDFDVMIIDTSPSVNLLTTNAWGISDLLISPIQPNNFSIKGMENMHNDIKDNYDNKYKCFVNFKQDNTVLNKQMTGYSKTLGIDFFNSEISKSIVVEEAILNNVPLWEYEPKHKVAKEFLRLTDEIIKEVLNG